MSNENSPPSDQTRRRRSSFTSGTLSEIFGRSPPKANGQSNHTGPIATAAANASAQQRRRSMAGLGLAGSPTSASHFSSFRNRNTSMSSSNSPNSSIEENAVEEGDAPVPQSPTSPFTRRVSFGAKALHDIRNGNTSSNDSYHWSEQIRNRAERSASMNQRQPPPPPTSYPGSDHHKAASVAIPEQPVKEIPKTPKKPDHFQERILKGDFYMD